MFTPGERFEATIMRISIEQLGATDAVKIFFRTSDDRQGSTVIFLTPKSMPMARGQLKACGFDCDNRSLGELAVDDTALSGQVVPLYVEDYQGKPQIRISTSKPVAREAIARYDRMLREVKRKDEGTDADEPPPIDDGELPF